MLPWRACDFKVPEGLYSFLRWAGYPPSDIRGSSGTSRSKPRELLFGVESSGKTIYGLYVVSS